jgi:competence protein ComEA
MPAAHKPANKKLLRRADQLAVAGLVLVGLIAMAAWWIGQGGLQGRVLEVEHAEPLPADFRIDINTADWPEIAQLPGIGETLAQRIVEVRNARGRFQSPRDLQQVRGIGALTLKRIVPYLLPISGKDDSQSGASSK